MNPLIPAWLDDHELTPRAFRVLCHLLRRAGKNGECFPSAKTIAAVCRIDRDSVWPALDEIEARGLCRRQSKRGRTNRYWLTLPKDGVGGKDGPTHASNQAETAGLQVAETAGLHQAEKTGHEGSPVRDSNEGRGSRSLSDADLRSVSKALKLSEAAAAEAASAFLDYKRSFPKDPTDANACITWFKASTPGKQWLAAHRGLAPALAEPAGWREYVRANMTDPTHADVPWASHDATTRAHILGEMRKSPTPL